MLDRTPKDLFMDILRSKNPDAVAWIKGNEENPQMSGAVRFFSTPYGGILVEAQLFGLPNIKTHKTMGASILIPTWVTIAKYFMTSLSGLICCLLSHEL